jgi:ubiquinol-cytochrome c reductase iron-sulfur subunit
VSDHPDRPAEAPGPPANGTPTGQEPETRVLPGPQGEIAARAPGGVLGRLKSPVSSTGRITKRGEAAGAGHAGDAADGDPVHVSGIVTTDSSISGDGDGGASYVVGAGAGGVAPPRGHRVADLDRRRERRAEWTVAFYFVLSTIATLAFVVTDLVGNTHKQYYTPLLGVFLALAVGGLGFGMIHWSKRLMGDEEAVQEREPHFSPPEEVAAAARVFSKGVETSGIARRPIVRRTLLMAGGALGLIGVVPLLNLGPLTGRRPKQLEETSWRFTKTTTDISGKSIKGIRMIDQTGRPIKLGDLAAGGLLTVFPALDESKGEPNTFAEPTLQVKGDSTVLLIRLHPGELRGKNVDGTYFDHIAFSKICTHAGCPVSLYEQQTHHLLCPCHQSIFDVTDGGRPIFGPAARPLPKLAITVDDEGYFIATGDFTEPVGPTFWERG